MSFHPTYGYVHEFGGPDGDTWAIGEDDGCLIFFPQWNIDSSKTAKHIWKDAWYEVERLGGFEATREHIRLLNPNNA